MRLLLIITLVVFAGCASTEWPTAGENPSGWQAIALSDLSMLPPNPTAADVIEKMGRPAGEIAVPWFNYHAADHDGKYYIFRFALGKRSDLRPRDRLIAVELVSSDSAVTVWPSPKKTEANQPPQRNAGSRPSSGDLPASETPSSLGPRG